MLIMAIFQDPIIGAAASVQTTSIVANAIVRVAAIAAGVYVVKLGHDTLVRGIKGDFEFSGRFGKLRGSAPGLLFVFLGCLAIGWAIRQEATGTLARSPESVVAPDSTGRRGTSLPPPVPLDSSTQPPEGG